jgi:protein involved in polysaccharide export with SLBB domain
MAPANLLKYIVLLCVCLVLVVARSAPVLAQGVPIGPLGAGTDESYKLGTGDKIKITVFGQDDLGGEFLVDDTGYLRLPLIGQVKAAGLTVHQFEDAVIAKLADGYLKDPRVSVEVTNYRPFYIIGEVNKPGEYPYVNGMNVLNAVALAGGYTYRADDTVVYVRRKGQQTEEKDPADQTTEIHPGDIVRIAERFF